MNPADYGGLTRAELVAEYVSQADLLVGRHQLFANASADRARQFWQVYEESDGGSVSARNRDAERETIAESVYLMELQGEIDEITTRLATINLLLTHGES